MIVTIERVRSALARAKQLGADDDIEEACNVAAAALGIPVEAVRKVAYQVKEGAPA